LSSFDAGDDEIANIDASVIPSFHGNVDGAVEFVGGKVSEGWRVVVVAAGVGLVDRARDVLAEREIAARVVESLPDAPDPGVATLVTGSLESGFQVAEAKVVVLTDNEFYGRTIGGDQRVVRKLASRRRNVVD